MPKFEVEISGWFLSQLMKGNVSIVMDCAYITVEAEDKQAAMCKISDALNRDPLSASDADIIE